MFSCIDISYINTNTLTQIRQLSVSHGIKVNLKMKYHPSIEYIPLVVVVIFLYRLLVKTGLSDASEDVGL